MFEMAGPWDAGFGCFWGSGTGTFPAVEGEKYQETVTAARGKEFNSFPFSHFPGLFEGERPESRWCLPKSDLGFSNYFLALQASHCVVVSACGTDVGTRMVPAE